MMIRLPWLRHFRHYDFHFFARCCFDAPFTLRHAIAVAMAVKALFYGCYDDT